MVMKQFKGSLEKRGVRTVESQGKPFDPSFHEAVGQEPSDLEQGWITRVEQNGYSLHGRLLRPARVIISTGKAAPAS